MIFAGVELTTGCMITVGNGNEYIWDDKDRRFRNANRKGSFVYPEEFNKNLEVDSYLKSIRDDFRVMKISKDGFTFWEREVSNESGEKSKSSDKPGTEANS